MARTEKKLIRLNKLIASSGRYSRREADRLIFSGRVIVNGEVVLNPATKFSKEDQVIVNGEKIDFDNLFYIKFYKPKGMLTSYDKFRDKKSLYDIPFFKKYKLGYSGRLDFESEGLIILSNDGDLLYKLQRPEKKVEKEYLVFTDKDLKDKEIELMRRGLKIKDISYLPCFVKKISEKKYKVILNEGKNRQIRRMFGFFGINVLRLVRVRIGNVRLGNLKPEEYKNLTDKELEELKKCIS